MTESLDRLEVEVMMSRATKLRGEDRLMELREEEDPRARKGEDEKG